MVCVGLSVRVYESGGNFRRMAAQMKANGSPNELFRMIPRGPVDAPAGHANGLMRTGGRLGGVDPDHASCAELCLNGVMALVIAQFFDEQSGNRREGGAPLRAFRLAL